MAVIRDIYNYLEQIAPSRYKMDFDNVGLLIGDEERNADRVLVALDITSEVAQEAVAWGAGLIISHHPVFFTLKDVTASDPIGRRVMFLIENRCAAICMHTNLDAAYKGVNDALANALCLADTMPLGYFGDDSAGTIGIGRIGSLAHDTPLPEFLRSVKTALNTNGLRYYNAEKPVRRVAVGGGSCGDYLKYAAEKGCDTFVTADIKYDVFLQAKEAGINIIDADHFSTENVIVPVLAADLSKRFPQTQFRISLTHGPTAEFYI